jgi:hypothetical protein
VAEAHEARDAEQADLAGPGEACEHASGGVAGTADQAGEACDELERQRPQGAKVPPAPLASVRASHSLRFADQLLRLAVDDGGVHAHHDVTQEGDVTDEVDGVVGQAVRKQAGRIERDAARDRKGADQDARGVNHFPNRRDLRHSN